MAGITLDMTEIEGRGEIKKVDEGWEWWSCRSFFLHFGPSAGFSIGAKILNPLAKGGLIVKLAITSMGDIVTDAHIGNSNIWILFPSLFGGPAAGFFVIEGGPCSLLGSDALIHLFQIELFQIPNIGI